MSQSSEKYDLIERLDAGGMAEVFRGRSRSQEGGFEKVVAIKRVLPHLAQNTKFVNMFLDEAKLSLYLNHANIVSVHDVGRFGETYFIVMEFVDGANLKKLAEVAVRKGIAFPVPLAVYITGEVCKGLAYAHEKRDPNGRALHIVHRDVSPPNVLISRQGEVKLTDFGLAKAQSQIEQTDPGVVKGKFGYLSPEAAMGEEVDAQTDVFAAGILLWEILAGRRLFAGETDLDTLQLVRTCKVPSIRGVNPAVTPELEEVIRRSLAKDRHGRYKTAREMGTELTRFLFAHGVTVTSFDLAKFMNEVLGPPAEPKGIQREVVAGVILEEVDRLTRRGGAAPASTGGGGAGGAFEDPRTWMGLDDESEPEPAAAAASTSYGAVGQAADRVAAGGTRLRTSPSGDHRVAISDRGDTPPPIAPAPNTPPPRREGEAAGGQARGAASSARGARPQEAVAPAASSGGAGKLAFYGLLLGVLAVGAYLVYLLALKD